MKGSIFNRRNIKSPKNGKWKEFSRHGVLIAEGNYLHDLKHGLWKQYYETGELLIEEMYDRGVPHGRYATYHLNGKLLSEGQYLNGSREGYFRIYSDTGNHIKNLLYIDNILIEEVEISGALLIHDEKVFIKRKSIMSQQS